MSVLIEGLTFAGCRLEAVAARGGMGVVWKATQLALGRPVALKAIAPDFAESAEFRERFQRESQLAASIDHPNVIPVYEAGELEGTLYLIMRWVDGADLRHLLRDSGKLAPGHALSLLRPVALALAAAHRRGLIHRDVKPANVLIARDDEHVYLTDFGIARMTSGESAMTRTGALVGTIDYTAPERFEGGRGNVSSDIYAFGCMLYETLTGSVPFQRPSDVSRMFAHINDPPPSARESAPDVPESVDAIIAKAMAKRPEDRFASAMELVEALTVALVNVDTVEKLAAAAAAGRRSETTKVRSATVVRSPGREAVADDGLMAVTPMVVTPRRRPRPLLLGAAAVLVAGVIVVAIVASSGGGRAGGGAQTSGAARTSSTAGTSGNAGTPAAREVTAQTGGLKAAQTVSLPGAPSDITASGHGGVGVSIPSVGKIAWLTRGAALTQPFNVGGHPSTIAAGPSGAWVGCSSAGPLVRIGLVAETRARATGTTQCPTALAANRLDNSIWAAFPGGRVDHYGAAGGGSLASATLGGAVSGIAIGEGWVWAADGDLVRINPKTGARRSFFAGAGAVSVALDQGVWTAHSGGFVTRFDPRAGHLGVNANLTITNSLTQVAAVEGAASVWAIGEQYLYRISYAKFGVTGTVTFRTKPVALTLADGSAWVATADGHLVQIKG